MAERYLRELIRKHQVFVLSTLAADEMDILHLCDFVMGVPAAEVVDAASAPPEEPTERDRAWFFKLFFLRGLFDGVERTYFFTYLQKTEDTFEFERNPGDAVVREAVRAARRPGYRARLRSRSRRSGPCPCG